MTTNKTPVTPFFKFTFLVWVKSVSVILIGVFLYRPDTIGNHNGTIISVVSEVGLIVIMSFVVTTPLFILMLTAVYFINKTNWSITKQKILIFCIYTLPILIISGSTGVAYVREVILFTLLILTVPAVMIYFTTLLPSNKQLTDHTKRDDVIDDISFKD